MEYKTLTTPAATGGTITTTATHRIHTFTSNGTFIANKSMNVEALVVAGGGGGAGAADATLDNGNGGGGAGGLLYNASLLVNSQTYSVVVGGGGAGGASGRNNGVNGTNSSLSSLTAIGGGGGGTRSTNGLTGGSGGGGGWATTIGGNGTTGQGYNGGSSSGSGSIYGGGGGGGAGEAGYDGGTTYGYGGNGTSVYSYLLITANAGVDISGTRWISGGGGGGINPNSPGAHGGNGGGGTGGNQKGGGQNAIVNTGSGGGGAEGGWQPTQGYPGGNGGSGIVIIRYPLSEDLTPANITATSLTITPYPIPCISGNCTVTADVIWTNTGGTSGTFTPKINVGTNPVVVYSGSLQTVGPSLTVSQQFVISGMTTGIYTICPDPN